ncbi:MAG: protease inhibitor I42 family protein [Bacteroidetes bacterium]|nr:protease inhibitor I42 family protein [Bacteroidota bacterium]
MNAISFLISITIFTYSCSSTQKSAMKDTFSIEGCPENITIKLGQTYTLKLPAIEGTGYLWIPTSSALISWDEEEKYEKAITDSNANKPEMVGSATRQILTCKGLKTGSSQIILEYMRPFGSRKPEKLCQFTVNVTP